MRILIATDAWHPQVNGVVRTYERLIEQLGPLGVELSVLAPHEFRTVPCPTYPEIRLAVPSLRRVAERFEAFRPDAVHIATEGPIGWMARRYCRARRLPFTTSFHTRFPEYLAQRFAVPTAWTTAVLRRFHNAGQRLDGGDAVARARAGRPRLRARAAVDARRRHRPVSAAPGAPVRRRPGLPLRRTHRGREEHQRVSRSRSAGTQGGSRRRPAAR